MHACRQHVTAVQAGSAADVLDLTTHEEERTEVCAICLEDVPQSGIHVIDECLHRFCASCLQTHAQSKLEDRQYPIPCPHPSCGISIKAAECDVMLRSFHDRQLLAQVITPENRMPCIIRLSSPNVACLVMHAHMMNVMPLPDPPTCSAIMKQALGSPWQC